MFYYINDLNRREREYNLVVVKIVYLLLKCVCCCNVIELSYVLISGNLYFNIIV